MALNAYLKMGDIKGQSDDKGHVDWIDLLSYSLGFTNTGDLLNAGRAEASDLSFTQLVNRASPILFQRCVQGEHIDLAQLDVVKDAENLQEAFLSFKFYEVLLSSLSQVSGGEGPTESVSFVFEKIIWTYKPQNEDGSLGAPITAEWDFSKKQ